VGVYPHQSPHWAALEIPDTSSKEEIKAQYRKLSVKYHPDKNKEVPREKFQRITEAYEALK
ncbi:Chaperone protein DnaJ, partial [Durusdinium trenchii]